jgi:hypothetical protein
MHALSIALSLPLFLAAAGSQGPSPGGTDPFTRSELPGGVRLAVLHVPDAPRQSTFTFLPFGLVSDAAGEAQFAHLVEHMLIRSTDPDSLEPDGMQINGETTSSGLRLDTYAEPEHWRASLERHVAWLTADAFEPGVLEREKQRIAGEEATTVAGGYTHKWAEAAWHQVVSHGRPHAALHGDVADADVAAVRACVERSIRVDPDVTIVSVGPIAPDDVRDVLRAALASALARTGARSGPRPASDSRPMADERADRHASLEATWDLPAHHYLEWTRLPDRGPSDRVAAHAAAQLAMIGLARDTTFGNGHALASVVATAAGRFLVLSASVSGPAAAADARRAFATALENVRTGAGMSLPVALFQLQAQALTVQDAGAARRQIQAMGRDASLVEAQLALNLINLERSAGLDRESLVAGWKKLDAEGMKAFVDGLLEADRSTLLLSPKPE